MKAAVVVIVSLVLSSFRSASGLTLDAVLARTLEHNPTIREAKARLEEAAGRRLVLRARTLGDARVDVPAGVQGGKRAGENEIQPFAFARGTFTQPLFDAARPAVRRRGDLEVLLAQQRLNVAVLEQLHGARIAFYTAAHYQSLGAVGEAQRLRLENNFRTQTERFEAGRADRNAVATSRILEQELKPRLEDFRRTYSGALLQLGQSMGEDLAANAPLPVATGNIEFAQVDFNVSADTADALRERADLKLARLLVRAANEDQRIIEAAYYPALDIFAGGTYIPVSEIRRGTSARRSDDVISSEPRAGATLTWRVIDNGLVGGAVKRQRAVREINELVLARLEADVPRQLKRLHNNLNALTARHEALSRAAEVAELTVLDLQNNLAEGLTSQLDYRTAESSFLETKAALLSVAFEQQLALAERDRVTGRYFQFSDDITAKTH